jgi:hypothetical protein
VLEEDSIAADGRIEDAEVEHAIGCEQDDRDREHWHAEHHDQRGRVVRPDEQRQTEP